MYALGGNDPIYISIMHTANFIMHVLDPFSRKRSNIASYSNHLYVLQGLSYQMSYFLYCIPHHFPMYKYIGPVRVVNCSVYPIHY